MNLTVDRVGPGSLTRANSRVTDGEGGRERERDRDTGDAVAEVRDMTEAYLQRARFVCVVHDREASPLAVFKARNVAPSRGMRQSIITVLHIDTTVRHRAPPRAHACMHTHDRTTFTNTPPHSVPVSLSLSPSFVLSRSLYLSVTRTHRELMTPSRIILVPRISSARYCHRERLMFRRNLSSLFYARTHAAPGVFSSDLLFLPVCPSSLSPSPSFPRDLVHEREWTRRRAIEGEIMSFRDSQHESASLPRSLRDESRRRFDPARAVSKGSMNLPSRRV